MTNCKYKYKYKYQSHLRVKNRKSNNNNHKSKGTIVNNKTRRMKKEGDELGTTFKFPETFVEIAQILGGTMRDFKMDRLEFEQLWRNRQLTKGELKNVWLTVDTSRDDKISENEWKFFLDIFVRPFEECDSDENYVLNKDELGPCLESDHLKNMGMTADNVTQVMESIDRDDEDDSINFADYIFLRRVKLGWEHCAGGTDLSKIMIPCAMKIAVPGWVMNGNDAYQLFDTIMAIQIGVSKFYDTYMNLGQYLEYAHVYYSFIAFEIPYYDGILQKKDFTRAIDYQELPTTLNHYLIDAIFGDKQGLQLQEFGCTLILYRTFKRYAKEQKYFLNEEEFMKVYDDMHINKAMVSMIDSFIFNDKEEIENAAELSRNNGTMTESDFLITFLQTNDKYKYRNSQKNKKYSMMTAYRNHLQLKSQYKNLLKKQEVEPNEQNRKLIYSIFEFKGKNMLTFPHFVRWWKISWFFLNCDEDVNRIIHWTELRSCVFRYSPPIQFTTDETSNLQYAQDFIGNPRVPSLNLKQFYDMFQYRDVFGFYKTPNFNSYVSKENMQKSFHFMGLKVTQDTIDSSMQGVDPVTRVPLYNYWAAFSNAMKEEIVAVKISKEEEIKKFMEENASKRKLIR